MTLGNAGTSPAAGIVLAARCPRPPSGQTRVSPSARGRALFEEVLALPFKGE